MTQLYARASIYLIFVNEIEIKPLARADDA
jgi:hypothetical protein